MLRPAWELRALTDALCAEAGFTPRVAFEGDDLRVVNGFVAAGLGVAVVPADEADPPGGPTGRGWSRSATRAPPGTWASPGRGAGGSSPPPTCSGAMSSAHGAPAPAADS